MYFSQEIIERIAGYAADLTPVSEIAALLDINEDMLRLALSDIGSEVRRAYLKAKAETAHMLRRQELEFAKVGSPLAIQLTGSYLREMTADEDF